MKTPHREGTSIVNCGMTATTAKALRGLFVAFATLLITSSASHATLILEIERLSDTQAIVTGTGTVDFAESQLRLIGASATIGDIGFDGLSGDLAMPGGNVVSTAFISIGTLDLFLNFLNSDLNDSDFSAGDAISGAATVTLDVETWAAIGTTGAVFARLNQTGTWSMVPEPSTALLLASGLAALALRRRRAVA